MTRDEILKMEAGNELDALVAERVMGWHKGRYVNPDGKTLTDIDDEWLDAEGHYMCGVAPEDSSYEDGEDFHLLHWHPSGSELWAFAVVDKLRKEYDVEMSAEANKFEVWGYYGSVSAPELPLAISRYALLTKVE